MKNEKELFLRLKKEWFLKILKGEKKEEYRDYTEYYVSRLAVLDKDGEMIDTRKFDTVKFQFGYSKTELIVKCEDVLIEHDDDESEEFNFDNSNFVIILGDILEKINCESLNV